jgi:hypothetical protein
MARINITYEEYFDIIVNNPFSSEYKHDGWLQAVKGQEFVNPYKPYSFEWLEWVDGYLDYCDILKSTFGPKPR